MILYSTLLNEGGGGETYLVYFFSEKLIGGRSSHEKIIRFYFLYEILKYYIFFKKIL